eukprot:6576317-Heterocapsa_arctica.AAC.1
MGVLDGNFVSDVNWASITDVLRAPRLLLVDSGAFLHTCPREAFPDVALEPLDEEPGAVVADGRALPMYGVKRVDFLTVYGEKIQIKFYVSN